ncbi:MAG: DUF4203 domain-containing protein [Candidatus Sumerlaeaceae bacterium]|nr:DUF4203 domain-containing protein [Candidatus Sumerlaeaceae bacterium]
MPRVAAENLQLILLILGAALCIGGWVLFYVGTRLLGIGFGLGFGFAFGAILCAVIKLQGPQEQALILICSAIGAVGGIFLARFVTSFLFFLIGFLFGAMLGRIGTELYFNATSQVFTWTPAIGAVVAGSGLAIGLLSMWLQKYVMIVITSFIGATYLVAGIPALARHRELAFLAIFVVSVGWQVILTTQLLSRKTPE